MCDSALLAASAEFKDHKEYSMFAVSAMLYMCFDGIAGAMAAQRPPGGKGTDSALNARLNLLTRSCTNAIASSLLVVGMAMSLQMQPTATWVVVMFGLVTVYIAQWQEYVTGKNIPPKRWARAEALLVAITIPLFTGITGTAVWQTALLGGWCINHVVALVFVAQAMGVILQNWDRIAEGGPGDSGTTPAGTGCLSPATPLLFGIWSVRLSMHVSLCLRVYFSLVLFLLLFLLLSRLFFFFFSDNSSNGFLATTAASSLC